MVRDKSPRTPIRVVVYSRVGVVYPKDCDPFPNTNLVYTFAPPVSSEFFSIRTSDVVPRPRCCKIPLPLSDFVDTSFVLNESGGVSSAEREEVVDRELWKDV